MSTRLLRDLQDPALHDHPVSGFEVIETHISWVLLTGAYAFKIKKPLDLGFVDCRDIRRRRHYCHEEIRLNRRLAPGLYLDVLAVTGEPGNIRLVPDPVRDAEPPADALEYLVRMRQFDQGGLLDRLQERGALSAEHIDSLAAQVAAFHADTERAGDNSPFGDADDVARWALQNFDQARSLEASAGTRRTLARLRDWTERELARLAERFAARKQEGFIRDCHGDLHLGNVAVVDGEVTVFDCIEFNDALRVIDVISEIAFMFMDLLSRNETALAWRLLDRYLERTGDHRGLELLRFYAVYRAMVRTKVAMIRGAQEGIDAKQAGMAARDAAAHLALAARLAEERRPLLILTRGLSGSGKSWLASRLVESCGLVRLRSDVERKRLYGLAAEERSGSATGDGLYTADASRLTYESMAEAATLLLDAGLAVIVDATFLKRWQRALFVDVARRLDVPLHILDLHADEATLRRRIVARMQAGGDPSEADLAILEHQLASAEPLDENEQAFTMPVDAGDDQADDAAQTLPDHLGYRVA